MSKRPSLAANVKAAAGDAPPPLVAQALRSVSAPEATPSETKRNPSRAGRKAVYAWVDPAQHKRLKRLSIDTERSIDSLVTEAVAALLDRQEE